MENICQDLNSSHFNPVVLHNCHAFITGFLLAQLGPSWKPVLWGTLQQLFGSLAIKPKAFTLSEGAPNCKINNLLQRGPARFSNLWWRNCSRQNEISAWSFLRSQAARCRCFLFREDKDAKKARNVKTGMIRKYQLLLLLLLWLLLLLCVLSD